MNGRERIWKRPFGSGHSPILLTHSTDNVEKYLLCHNSGEMVLHGLVRAALGARFCEWVRKTSLLSDTRPHSPSVLTLTSVPCVFL